MNSDFNSPQAGNSAPPASGPVPARPAAPVAPAVPSRNAPAANTNTAGAEGEHPVKSFLVTLFLSTAMGQLGLDRIYLGKTGTGVLKFVTLGGFGIWALIDAIRTALGKARAKDDDRQLKGYAENRDWVKTSLIMYVVFFIVYCIGMGLLVSFAIRNSDDTDTGPSRGNYNRQIDDERMRRFDDTSNVE